MENVIYKISNNINDKIYIGSSKKFNLRYNQHKFHLIKKTHHSRILQNHVNKYGFDSLKFEIIEKCTDENLINREQYYIDLLEPSFNIRRIADSNFGLKRTKEQIQNIINGRLKNGGFKKGWKHSKLTISKIKETRLKNGGYNVSLETKLKIGNSNRNKKRSDEVKLKISKSTLGKIVSNKTKEKLSKQKTGNKNPMFGKSGNKHHNFNKRYKQINPKSSKKVIDLNTNIIYDNSRVASKLLNIPFGTFSKYLLNYTKKITNFKYHEG